jgi:hypothetical protein
LTPAKEIKPKTSNHKNATQGARLSLVCPAVRTYLEVQVLDPPGKGDFRRQARLEEHQAQARELVQTLQTQAQADPGAASRRAQPARLRAAQDREQRSTPSLLPGSHSRLKIMARRQASTSTSTLEQAPRQGQIIKAQRAP